MEIDVLDTGRPEMISMNLVGYGLAFQTVWRTPLGSRPPDSAGAATLPVTLFGPIRTLRST